MSCITSRSALAVVLMLLLAAGIDGPSAAGANRPGGGTGEGPDVAVTDNGDGTVTMANGIVSIVIVKKTSRLNEVTYTCDRGGKPQTEVPHESWALGRDGVTSIPGDRS